VGVSRLRLLLLDGGVPGYLVAARCGFPPSRLSEYVMGRKPIPLVHQIVLCEVLGCSVDELVGWSEEDRDLEVAGG